MATKRGRRAANTQEGTQDMTVTGMHYTEDEATSDGTEEAIYEANGDGQDNGQENGQKEEKEKRTYKKATEKFNFPESLSPAEDVPDEEMVPYSRDTAERDETQKQVDADVKTAYDAWVEAGKPAFANRGKGLPSKRYVVPPENVEAVEYMLDRAARLHDVGIRRAPVTDHESGRKIVQFWAMDKRARKPKPKEEESKTESENESGSEAA